MSTQTKKNTGRPTQPIKRDKAMAVRQTVSERFIITEKAKRAGMTLTSYLRHMAIHGKLIERLSEQDRKDLRNLIQMTNEIHKLVVLAEKEGMLKATVEYESLRNRISSLIDQINHDK